MNPTVQPSVHEDIAALSDRLRELASTRQRVMVGLCGAPGVGKSMIAQQIADQLGAAEAAVVPMDGFHLAGNVIERLGLMERKGSIDTFDRNGYLALLRRLRANEEDVVYAPEYRREFEEPIAAAIAIPASVRIILTEGNYLLIDAPVWRDVRDVLDETWYIADTDAVRIPRLVERHVRFGKEPAAATEWAQGTDQLNAMLIAASQRRADIVVQRSTE